MDKLKVIYKDIRDCFRAYVPPCTATVDEEHHYEVWAQTPTSNEFFGSVILHKSDVELAFNVDIPDEEMQLIFADPFYKAMNGLYQFQLKTFSNNDKTQLKDNLNTLYRFYVEKGWINSPDNQ